MKCKDMKSFNEIKVILNKYKNELKIRYGVKEIFIFGSFARNEQNVNSDIDILVEFYKDRKTFDNYMDLKNFLEKILNIKVDLLTKDAIKPKYKKYIYKDLINV